MSSSLEYVQFIAEQLSELEEISYRKMFGKYAFYYKKVGSPTFFDVKRLPQRIKQYKISVEHNLDKAAAFPRGRRLPQKYGDR